MLSKEGAMISSNKSVLQLIFRITILSRSSRNFGSNSEAILSMYHMWPLYVFDCSRCLPFYICRFLIFIFSLLWIFSTCVLLSFFFIDYIFIPPYRCFYYFLPFWQILSPYIVYWIKSATNSEYEHKNWFLIQKLILEGCYRVLNRWEKEIIDEVGITLREFGPFVFPWMHCYCNRDVSFPLQFHLTDYPYTISILERRYEMISDLN